MEIKTDKFQIEYIEWSYNELQEITGDRNPRQLMKTEIKSIKARCMNCGNSWKSRNGDGYFLVMPEDVFLTCPSCKKEDKIKKSVLKQ